MGNKILDIKNISLNYHTFSSEIKALENISFYLNKGDFASILGPSGCGKSTLLSIISGLIKNYKGNILINNINLENSRLSIGYMLQKDLLFEWRNLWKNITLGLEIQNKLNDENINFVKNLAKKYGLINYLNFKPSELSGGMRQKAALIRTLALKPDILLLDEPFSALDYQTRIFLSNEIASIIRKEKKTALLVTHDIEEAINISNKIIIFSKCPAKIKKIYKLDLYNKYKSILDRSSSKEFNNYFHNIWKEIEFNE